jgi:hypothetical protein
LIPLTEVLQTQQLPQSHIVAPMAGLAALSDAAAASTVQFSTFANDMSTLLCYDPSKRPSAGEALSLATFAM